MPFIKTSKSVHLSSHTATRCVECLIRLVQANPTVTNCALLFTLISLSGKVGLCCAHLRSASEGQRSLLNKFKSSLPHHINLSLLLSLSSERLIHNKLLAGSPLEIELMCISAHSDADRWAAFVCLSLESPGMQGTSLELSDRCCRGLQGIEIAG